MHFPYVFLYTFVKQLAELKPHWAAHSLTLYFPVDSSVLALFRQHTVI